MSAPPLSAIGEHVDPVSSWTPERDDPEGVFTYIDLSAVDQDAKVVSGARELACAEAPSRARQLIRAGDVLVSTVRPNLNGVALVPPELDGATASTGFCVLRPRAGQLDARYLYQWVKSPRFVSDMVRKATGASYPAVSARIVCESKLPLPPLPEQQRIAEILHKADALRGKRRAALVQLDTLPQSIFLDMFGDPATNPEGWPAATLGDVLIAIRNGANAEQSEEPDGWPITRIETISDGTINPERVRWIEPDESLVESFQLEPGDILFSHINSVEHIGKTALYSGTPTPLIHGINLLRLRPKLESVDPVWLLHLLKHDFVRTHFRTRCKRAVNQASLNQPDIRSVRTFLPPLSLQHAFARRVASLQSLACAHRASLAAQDSLFASLLQRAFQGEL